MSLQCSINIYLERFKKVRCPRCKGNVISHPSLTVMSGHNFNIVSDKETDDDHEGGCYICENCHITFVVHYESKSTRSLDNLSIIINKYYSDVEEIKQPKYKDEIDKLVAENTKEVIMEYLLGVKW